MKKILALLLAFAMLFAFAACGEDKTSEETTTTTVEDTEIAVEEDTTAPAEDVDVPVEDATAEAGAEDATAAADESTTVAESTVPAIAEAPTSTADIIALYNNAVNSAYNAKAGFEKERYADNENLKTSGALGAFKDLVYKFMGIGAENKYTESVAKGKWDSDLPHHYLRKSTLTAADVTNATCTEKNGQYTVVLSVKGGNSKGSADEKFTNAPIDKCGICVGDEDKGYYDHKTGPVIYDALDDIYGSAIIEESYNNAKVTAVIDGATGNLVKLRVDYDITCNIDVGLIGGGDATGSAHIRYTNFKY